MAFELKSPNFSANAEIPSEYTCQGKDVSPELSWADAPVNVKSFALICDDPDAPFGAWVHWIIYNIPSKVNSLPKGVPVMEFLRDGTMQGENSFGKIGYGGPCPPQGKPHRYFFKIYALDTILSLKGRVEKTALTKAMAGHILAQAELIWIYQK